jgi:hypothetical protein
MGSNLVRILILDDEHIRHEQFAKFYTGEDTVHVTTYAQFVHELEAGSPWDLVHLDHDLGPGDSYLDGWGEIQFFTGQHAARRVCELHDHQLPGEVIVHSMNPLGAQNMLCDLSARKIKVKWCPYGEFLSSRR